MDNLTKKLMEEKISKKMEEGEISFGITKNTKDFVLKSFRILGEKVEKGIINTDVFCVCEYIENNSIYSKAFSISL